MTTTPNTFLLRYSDTLEARVPAAYLIQEQALLLFKDSTHAVVFAIPVHHLNSVERLTDAPRRA